MSSAVFGTQASSMLASSSVAGLSSLASSAVAVSSASVVAPPVTLTLVGDSGVSIDQRDNQKYKWIRIGTQIWLRQNLNYAPVGIVLQDSLLGVSTRTGTSAPTYDWKAKSGALTSDGSITNGRFYTWTAANQYCPAGWHLPTQTEFGILAELAESFDGACAYSIEYTTEEPCANVLKSKYGWSFAANGNDTLHFEAVPAEDGGSTALWSATPNASTPGNYYYRTLYYHFKVFGLYDDPKSDFKSVRCIANTAAGNSGISAAASSSSSVIVVGIGTLNVPKTPQTITASPGFFTVSLATACSSKILHMADLSGGAGCSATIGGITMNSIENYSGPITQFSLQSLCTLSCD